jgi:type III secretion protein L
MGKFAFIDETSLKIAPGASLLKAREYAILCEAENLLAEARREAEAIMAEVHKRSEEARTAGFAEGLRQAKASASNYMIGIVSKSRDYLEESEERMMAAVLAVVRKLIGDMDGNEVAVRMVRAAMAVVSRQNTVSVLVPPERVEAVKAEIKRIMQPYPRISEVKVFGDPKLKGDHVVLETKVGRVEASLESQLKSLTGALTDSAPGKKERLEKELRAIEADLCANMGGR